VGWLYAEGLVFLGSTRIGSRWEKAEIGVIYSNSGLNCQRLVDADQVKMRAVTRSNPSYLLASVCFSMTAGTSCVFTRLL
jgi:hypothetical protein